MDNAAYTQIAQELFTGLYSEAAPESLPMGGSPRCINCDFLVGEVTPRPGKESVYYYVGLYALNNTRHATSVNDGLFSGEQPWTNPSNAQLDIQGTYAETKLAGSVLVSVADKFSVDNISSGTVSGTFHNPVAVGDLFSVLVWQGPGFQASQVAFDSLGNSYTKINLIADANFTMDYFYTYNGTANGEGCSITVALAGGGTSCAVLGINMRGASGAPVGHVAASGSGSTLSSGSFSPAAESVVFSFCGMELNTPTSPVSSLQLVNGLVHNGASTINSAFEIVAAGSYNAQWTQSGAVTGLVGAIYFGYTIPAETASWNQSEQLTCINYGFSIAPTEQVIGLQVIIDGLQSIISAPEGEVEVQIIAPGFVSELMEAQLTQTYGVTTIGLPTSNWGLALTPAMLNDPNFGVLVEAFAGPLVLNPTGGSYIDALVVASVTSNTISASAMPSQATDWALWIYAADFFAGSSIPPGICILGFFSINANILSTGTSSDTSQFPPGTLVTFSGYQTTDAFLNGTTATVLTNIGGTITFGYIHANYSSAGTGGYCALNGWQASSAIGNTRSGEVLYQYVPTQTTVAFAGSTGVSANPCGQLALFGTIPGITPALVQTAGGGGSFSNITVNFGALSQQGNTIIGIVQSGDLVFGSAAVASCTDEAGNHYTVAGYSTNANCETILVYATNCSPAKHINIVLNNTLAAASFTAIEMFGLAGVGAFEPYIYDIAAVKLKAWLSPNPPPSFNYIKTFVETGGEILTLALGDNGVMYQEDVVNLPGALVAAYQEIEPLSFAQSATLDDREFIAISNLQNGTDIPYAYTPPNFDRLSQVGPGTAPSLGTSSSAASVSVVSITQAPPTVIRRIGWGASANVFVDSTAGSILTIFGYGKTPSMPFSTLPNAVPGGTVVLSGIPVPFPRKGGGSFPYNLNGTYTIISVEMANVGGNELAPCFTVQAPASEWGYSADFGTDHPPTEGWFYQATLATITTNTQVPNTAVGQPIEIAGTGGGPPTGYDGTWTTLSSPNALTLQITATKFVQATGIATYSFNVINQTTPPVYPVVGQLVTVTQTLNGNGMFNVANASITSVTTGSFSIQLHNPAGVDVPSNTENGSGQIFGTVFTFDPLQLVGTKTSGTVVTAGVILAGTRKVCYSFLTRNGYMTQPSPIAMITIAQGAGALVVSGLLTGPPNVIARIIHLTATNGGNFYNIPQDVIVVSASQNVTNTKTWLNDNTSTSISLSFSDGVLLAADQIDIEGNNRFECAELGSCVALVPYSNRLFAIGEQNKLTNLLNWSFDGGALGNPGSQYPAGWTVDSIAGGGGNMVSSPLFGFAYQISNTTGITQVNYGLITQPAYQDEFLVPIIEPSTTYSVRVTAMCPTGASGGFLNVDLFSPSAPNAPLGSFSLPLASIASTMQIYTGTMLLTPGLSPVPVDLLLRLWTRNIPNGSTVIVDRVEVFPTEQPNLNQQVTGTYSNDFESFDQVTGVILGTNVNQQPIVSAFVLFDAFYMVKIGSLITISDNGSTEPNNWNVPRTVSAAVGGTGPYSVTTGVDAPNSGEEWSIVAGRPGAYIFSGGQPIKLTEEIQAVWNQINWSYGHTLWVQNDITNRRILFGVPLNEKNAQGKSPVWLQAGLIANGTNPTTPNVILELNYKQINTGSALEGSPEIHKSYSGKLIASEIVRKWSLWTIKAPCAAFIRRNDNTAPLFIGNSDHTGKIYDLIDGLLNDDGAAFFQDYITSAFVSAETGQGTQMNMTRFNYDYMLLDMDGTGEVVITTWPNSLDSPYFNRLLPDLVLPASTNGDIEIPLNEVGTRMYLEFVSTFVDAGFSLRRIIMAMHEDPWSPVRGVND